MGFTSKPSQSIFLPRMLRVASCLLALLAGCAGGAGTRALSQKACVENFDPAADYFPEKTKLEFARNFSVDYHRSYKVVTLRPADGGATEHYVLLQCGAPR